MIFVRFVLEERTALDINIFHKKIIRSSSQVAKKKNNLLVITPTNTHTQQTRMHSRTTTTHSFGQLLNLMHVTHKKEAGRLAPAVFECCRMNLLSFEQLERLLSHAHKCGRNVRMERLESFAAFRGMHGNSLLEHLQLFAHRSLEQLRDSRLCGE